MVTKAAAARAVLEGPKPREHQLEHPAAVLVAVAGVGALATAWVGALATAWVGSAWVVAVMVVAVDEATAPTAMLMVAEGQSGRSAAVEWRVAVASREIVEVKGEATLGRGGAMKVGAWGVAQAEAEQWR